MLAFLMSLYPQSSSIPSVYPEPTLLPRQNDHYPCTALRLQHILHSLCYDLKHMPETVDKEMSPVNKASNPALSFLQFLYRAHPNLQSFYLYIDNVPMQMAWQNHKTFLSPSMQ